MVAGLVERRAQAMSGHTWRLHSDAHVGLLVELLGDVLDFPISNVVLPQFVDPLLPGLIDALAVFLLHLKWIE